MSAARTAVLAALFLVAIMALPTAALAAPTGTGHAVVALPTKAAPAVPTSPSYGADTWQEFQHDAWNTGDSTDTGVAGTISWNQTLPAYADGAEYPTVSSPVVGQGMVFTAVGDSIEAFNATSGTPAWQTDLGGMANAVVVGTPLLWRGDLFLGEDFSGGGNACPGPGGGTESRLYVVNATTGTVLQTVANGQLGWMGHSTASSIVPLPFGNEILVTDCMGYLYTLSWSGTALTEVGSNAAARAAFTRTTGTPSVAFVPGYGWTASYLSGASGGGNQNTLNVFELTGAGTPQALGYAYAAVGPAMSDGAANLAFTGIATGSITVENFTSHGVTFPIAFFTDDNGGGASELIAYNLSANTVLAWRSMPELMGASSGSDATPALVPVNATETGIIVTDVNGTATRYNFFDNHTAAASSIDPVWLRDVFSSAQASPAVAGGSDVYVANTNATSQLWDLSAANGNNVWTSNLTWAVRANPALGYSRLFEVDDHVGGGVRGNLTAFGPVDPDILEINGVTSTGPIASGGTAMVQAHVVFLSPRGGVNGGVAAGATVNFTTAGKIGTWKTASATVQANGFAYDNWTSPAYSPVWYNETVDLQVWEPNFVSNTGSGNVEVMAGGSLGGGGLQSMAVAVTPVSNALPLGMVEELTITSTKGVGGALGGVALVASLNAGGVGTISSQPNPTDAAGLAWANFTAPATLSGPMSTLITITASLTGYSGAETSALVEMSPGAVTPMVVTITPATSTVISGQSQVLNVSAWTTGGAPLAGAAISLSFDGAVASEFNATTGVTNVNGNAWFQFTAPSQSGTSSVLVNASVTLANYAGGVASAVVAVVPQGVAPPPGTYSISVVAAPSETSVATGASGSITVTVTNISASAPAAGVTVTVTPVDGDVDFTAASAVTSSTGTATFDFKAGGTAGSELVTFAASGSRLVTTTTSAAIAVTAPATSTSTSSSSGALGTIEYALIGLVILLAIGLIAALVYARRRHAPPTMSAGSAAAAGGAGGAAAAESTSSTGDESDEDFASLGKDKASDAKEPAAESEKEEPEKEEAEQEEPEEETGKEDSEPISLEDSAPASKDASPAVEE